MHVMIVLSSFNRLDNILGSRRFFQFGYQLGMQWMDDTSSVRIVSFAAIGILYRMDVDIGKFIIPHPIEVGIEFVIYLFALFQKVDPLREVMLPPAILSVRLLLLLLTISF